jgi:hypothetical protein
MTPPERLTIFADDAGDLPSQDYLWVEAWLSRWAGIVVVAEYSSGGWEHLWNVEGPASAIAEVPSHLRCASDWAGLPTPGTPLNLSRRAAEQRAAHWLYLIGVPGDDSTWSLQADRTTETETHVSVVYAQVPSEGGTLPFPELPNEYACRVCRSTAEVVVLE